MLAIPIIITSTMAFAAIAAGAALSPSSYNDSSAAFTFLAPALEPFIHVDFLVNVPTNTSTELGLVGRAPNMGGNVTGAITGTIVAVGAAYELIPAGPDGIRSFYHNQWSINASTTDAGTDDGTATILMNADAFIQYANEAVFGQGAVTFEGRPGTNLSFGAFVGQVSGNYGTGTAVLDVFKVVPVGRVDGQPIGALLPPGQAGGV